MTRDDYIKKSRSHLEQQAIDLFENDKTLPKCVEQYHFHKWRFDFAWPKVKVAVEIDGYTNGGRGHVSGTQYSSDCRKLNQAQKERWVLLRFDAKMLNKEMVETIKFMILSRIPLLNAGFLSNQPNITITRV